MELIIPQERQQRNQINGQFLKGHVSLTKGVPRTKWMSKATDRRLREQCAKRLREQPHPENAGKPRRKVVLITDKGKFYIFASINEAARRTELEPHNIGRCCRQNESKREKIRTWAKNVSKQDGSLVNTDHRYKGVRWYFEDDNIWTTKIQMP